MSSGLLTVVATPLLSFALAVGSVRLVRRLALRYGVVEPPAPDRRHREPTPLFGGLSILGATLAALAATGSLPWWMALSALALLAVGMIDDAIVLSPLQKLGAELLVASGVVAFLPGFRLTPWPAVDAMLALFWLLAATNSFNLVDGLDGLASGVGIVAAVAIAATAILRHDPALAVWALALAGALSGFLLYNFHPASIFMGDGGALPVGLLLGVLSLRVAGLAGNSRLTVYVFPVLVMLVPLLDSATVTVTRLAIGRSISRRGLDHSHHRLLSLGLSDGRVVLLCWAVAALGAACAVAACVMPHRYLLPLLPFIVLVCALLGLFMMDLTFDRRAPGAAYGYVPRIARLILNAGYKWRLVDAALDAAVITTAYFGAFLIRLDFRVSNELVSSLISGLPWVLLATYPALYAAGVYRGIWRYTGLSDVIRFADGSALAGVLLVGVSLFRPVLVSGSIVALFAVLLFDFLAASRLSFRLLRKGIQRVADADERVLIVGAGQLGATAAQDLASERGAGQRLVGFVDDDGFKRRKLVNGHPVLGSLDDLEQIYSATGFTRMLIAAESLDEECITRLCSFAKQHNLDLRRFSIELNEVDLAMNGAGPERRPISPQRARRARA